MSSESSSPQTGTTASILLAWPPGGGLRMGHSMARPVATKASIFHRDGARHHRGVGGTRACRRREKRTVRARRSTNPSGVRPPAFERTGRRRSGEMETPHRYSYGLFPGRFCSSLYIYHPSRLVVPGGMGSKTNNYRVRIMHCRKGPLAAVVRGLCPSPDVYSLELSSCAHSLQFRFTIFPFRVRSNALGARRTYLEDL